MWSKVEEEFIDTDMVNAESHFSNYYYDSDIIKLVLLNPGVGKGISYTTCITVFRPLSKGGGAYRILGGNWRVSQSGLREYLRNSCGIKEK